MSNIHLLWTSAWDRPTNTEYQHSELTRIHPSLSQWDITRAQSNAKALEALLNSNSEDNNISLAPFYNVHGKWVRDTMKMIAENYTRLKLLHVSRLSVEYILAHSTWANLSKMSRVVTHDQAILQTRQNWGTHGIPSNLTKTWGNNTAAWLNFLIDNPTATDTIAISTPWQWRESDGWVLTRVDNFGPKNNHTYFGIFWLKDSDIPDIGKENNTENPEWIEFWVIELEDNKWSLAHALENIASQWKNIHSIMSFLQNNGKVIFVVAYSIDNWETSSISPAARARIYEVHDEKNNMKLYTYRLSIPNSRWSLGRTLGAISHLVDIRSIESIGISREDADFIISVAGNRGSSDEIRASIESMLDNLDYFVKRKVGDQTNWEYTFNTLKN